MESPPLQQTFIQALDALVDQVKEDRSILAAILCGSLSYDTVWARSDIDLVLVTIDDRTLELTDRALYADGVNVLESPAAQNPSVCDGACSIYATVRHPSLYSRPIGDRYETPGCCCSIL